MSDPDAVTAERLAELGFSEARPGRWEFRRGAVDVEVAATAGGNWLVDGAVTVSCLSDLVEALVHVGEKRGRRELASELIGLFPATVVRDSLQQLRPPPGVPT